MTLIDAQMAAVVLGCSVRHVQNLVRDGTLTNHSGKANRVRVDLNEIEQRIEDGTTKVRPRYGPRRKLRHTGPA